MPLELDENRATYQIRSYKPGAIQINDRILYQSVIIMPEELIENWSPQKITELTAEMLHPLIKFKPDIVLIGTGEKQAFLPIEIYGELLNHQIGVEVMNTSAACRTYNALTAEGRQVIAALIIS